MANPNVNRAKPVKQAKAKRKKVVKMKRCDAVWQQIIRLKFKGKCVLCGKSDGQLHTHHLISRAAHFYRHNVNNGVLLCARHHVFSPDLSAHGAPWAFDAALRLARPDQHDWWARNRTLILPALKIDYTQVLDTLKEQLAKLENTHD